MVTVDGHFPEVCPPHSARVFAEIIFGLAVEPVPGALNVLRGERLAIVPFDTLPKLECEAGAVLVPRPALGKLGNNRIDATDRLHRVKHDEPIEDGASSHHGRKTDLLQDRQARGVSADVHAKRSPVLLREGWISTKTDGDDRSRGDRMAHATDSGADVQTTHPRDPAEVWPKGRGQRDYSCKGAHERSPAHVRRHVVPSILPSRE